MRTYLAIFCGLSLVSVGSVATLNYVVDPYLIHQWDTPQLQRLRPQREKLNAWGKTYAIARYRPAVLYLGNSRTEVALPAPHPAFGGAAVFNGALSGASVGDMVAMARHALALGPPDTVVWGIDGPSFSMVVGNSDFDRELVADGSAYLPRRVLLDLKRALTLDMTLDSVSLLSGSFGSMCRSNLAFYGQRDIDCMVDRKHGWRGTAAAVRPRMSDFVRGDGPTDAAMSEFDAALGALCQAGTKVRSYINPTHASMHVVLYSAGKWNALERWQQRLTGITARRRAAGCDIRLYDFSGFNSVTMEPLPQASGASEMRYYWEPSHYRDNVGRMLIQAMFGGDPGAGVPEDFGVELTPQSVAIHQLAQRTARDNYMRSNPVEAEIARGVARSEAFAQAQRESGRR